MRIIKFRQENNGQKPKTWHYWGFIEGEFISPLTSIASGKSYQYTGLLDKSGKEIYEGDIVKDKDNWEGEIGWEKEMCVWKIKWFEHPWQMLFTLGKGEIIGNIYQNKIK